MKHRRDESGELEKLARKIIKQEPDYAPLKHLKILYVWRDGKPKHDKEGDLIAAEASVISTRLRDVFGFDVSIEVCQDIWDRLSKDSKLQLVWHELRHFAVAMDEDDSGKMVPVRDKEKRIEVTTVPHDIRIRTFSAEIERFGVAVDELPVIKYLAKTYIRAKKGKLKKYARQAVLLDGAPEQDPEEA